MTTPEITPEVVARTHRLIDAGIYGNTAFVLAVAGYDLIALVPLDRLRQCVVPVGAS